MLLLLSGCTGSQETPPSTLLVIGHADDKLGLVATASLFSQDSSTPLDFLVNRTVAGEALALDVVDRSNRRSQAVVLVAKGEAYALEFFDLRGIDPSNFQEASMFQPSRAALKLAVDSIDKAASVTTKPLAFCPSSLQVSRSGKYVVLINDKRRCSKLTSTGLLVLDVQANPARIVYHRETSIFPNALYLEQSSERVYYFSEQAGGARLEQLTLSTLSNSELLTLNNNDRPPALRDVQRYDKDLLVLRDSNYSIIKNIFSSDNASQGDTITTSSGSQAFVVDDFISAGYVYIVGSRGLTAHKTASDADEKIYSVGSTLASYDFANRLIYAPRTGNVGVFDAISQQTSTTISFSQLKNPKVSTVIQGVISASSP